MLEVLKARVERSPEPTIFRPSSHKMAFLMILGHGEMDQAVACRDEVLGLGKKVVRRKSGY